MCSLTYSSGTDNVEGTTESGSNNGDSGRNTVMPFSDSIELLPRRRRTHKRIVILTFQISLSSDTHAYSTRLGGSSSRKHRPNYSPQGLVSRVSPLVVGSVQTLPSILLSQLPYTPDLMSKMGQLRTAKISCPCWTYPLDDDSPIVVFF